MIKNLQKFEISLSKLLKDSDNFELLGNIDVIVKGIENNSRNIREGFLFAALEGSVVNGTKFINQSIESGAKIVLCKKEDVIFFNNASLVTIIFHNDPRKFFTVLLSRFYGKQPEVNIAITGTNGKTSTSFFCQQILKNIGFKSCSMGTIGIIDNDGIMDTNISTTLTTADPVSLYSNLFDLYSKNITHNFMEVSSHGLDQYRVDGVDFKVAAFTSFSKDHLDYHKTVENYLDAKLRLFKEVIAEGSNVVINNDMLHANKIIELCKKRKHKIITYGYGKSDIKIIEVRLVNNKENLTDIRQFIKFSYKDKEYNSYINLAGKFQVYNILCSLGIIVSLGINIEEVLPCIANISSVPGRMQHIVQDKISANIFVDYAHTEDALREAINALSSYKKNNLWLVFGCGGDRYINKRFSMGEIASNFADKVIITNDNPRNENPKKIAEQIKSKCPKGNIILDRREAIVFAISNLEKGDILLVAGKGHEKYQIIGSEVIDFNDVEVIKEAINNINSS